MNRSKKNRSVYQYLDAVGVLETGTEAEIEIARKRYWTEYKRQWKIEKKKKSKTFEIFFNMEEVRIITCEAKKHRTSPTNYIKQSALANRQGIIDPVALGEFRELLILNNSALQTLIGNNKAEPQVESKLLEQILKMEKSILEFLFLLKQR